MRQIELTGHNYGEQIRAGQALISGTGSGRSLPRDRNFRFACGLSTVWTAKGTEYASGVLAIKSPNCFAKRMRMSNLRAM